MAIALVHTPEPVEVHDQHCAGHPPGERLGGEASDRRTVHERGQIIAIDAGHGAQIDRDVGRHIGEHRRPEVHGVARPGFRLERRRRRHLRIDPVHQAPGVHHRFRWRSGHLQRLERKRPSREQVPLGHMGVGNPQQGGRRLVTHGSRVRCGQEFDGLRGRRIVAHIVPSRLPCHARGA